jgi:E3 ubiquitin-protein ligase RBBP6
MESAHCLLPKVPSPTLSAASKGEQKPSPVNGETPKIQETRDEGQAAASPLRTAKRRRTENAADISEFTHESVCVREPTTSPGSVPLAKEEVHQKVADSEAGKVSFCGVLNLFLFPPSSQHLLSQVLLRSSAHRTPDPVF